MVKGKRNGLTFTECSVKIYRILLLSPHIENEATTMQRNRSVHTAWMTTFFKLTGALFSWGHFLFFRLSDDLLKEPTSSLLAYTHRRPRLTERKRTFFTLRERNAVCETKNDALHVQANSYTTFMLESFYFMKAFTRKNEFVMFHYFLFIIIKTYSTIAFYILKV